MTMPLEPQGQEPNGQQQTGAGQQNAGAPNTGPQGGEAQDVSQLPEWAQKAIKDARAEAAKHRTEKKQTAQQVTAEQERLNKVLAALGITADGQEDLPEHAKAKVSEYEQRAQEAEARAVELAYENTVTRVAGTVGADAEALLDSDSFRSAVGDELGDDFGDDDLKKAVAKVAKEFATKPRFAAQRGAARSGADFTGAPASAPNIDQAIADAQSKGDLRAAIALKRARARAGQ